MSEERLRLIAEFRDQASAGVRRLGRELGEVRETPGMSAAARWMKGFELNSKAMQQAGSSANAVMGSLGLGGLAAAGGIAAAVRSFRDLAQQTSGLQAISRETGIATTQINIFRNAAKELHVDPEAMSSGIVHLTGQLALARRGYGELYGLLNQVEPEFMRKIMNEDPTSAMKDVLDRLARIPEDYTRSGRSLADGIAAQKQWTQQLLGDDGLNRLVEMGPKALHAALADAAKNTPAVTQAMVDAAEALNKSVVGLDNAMSKFQTEAGPFIFKQLTLATNDFTEAFKDVEHAIEWFGKVKDHPVKSLLEATEGAIDRQAEENRKNPNGIIFDLPGAVSKLDHWVKGDKDDRGDQHNEPATTLPPVVPDPQGDATRSPLQKLRDAMERREGPPPIVLPPGFHPSSYEGGDADRGGLFHRASYGDDEDGGGRRSGFGGSLVWEFREAVASGAKAGVLGALREFQSQGSDGLGVGGGDGGVIQASYGGEGSAGGSSRYGAAGGRSLGGSAAAGGGSFGSGSAPARGALAANQKAAYAAARGEGLSDVQARALVANMSGEGLAVPHDYHWDGKHYSGGIVQWDPQRAEAIKGKFGDVPWKLSVPEQTRAAIWEYRNNPRFARTKRAMEGSDPGEMIHQLVENYESPKNQGAAISRRMGFFRGFDPNASPTASAGSLGAQLADMKRHGLISDEQCVTLAMGAVGIPKGALGGGNVHDWRKGVGASDGTLMPGTPIATFLDRRGRETDRYAGGGAGTPGANLDHAGIFQRYVLGEAGKRIGMVMAEQFKGSGGVHLHTYMFGQGAGEKNGSAYHAIMGPDGLPLGHDANPMAGVKRHLQADAPPPRKSLLGEAAKSGINGSMTHKVEGAATVEIRGLPEHRGVRTKTSGLIEAVNLRRGGPLTQVG